MLCFACFFVFYLFGMPLCHISSPLCYSLSVCVRVRVCELLNKHGCVVLWLADPRLSLSIQTPVVSLTPPVGWRGEMSCHYYFIFTDIK